MCFLWGIRIPLWQILLPERNAALQVSCTHFLVFCCFWFLQFQLFFCASSSLTFTLTTPSPTRKRVWKFSSAGRSTRRVSVGLKKGPKPCMNSARRRNCVKKIMKDYILLNLSIPHTRIKKLRVLTRIMLIIRE